MPLTEKTAKRQNLYNVSNLIIRLLNCILQYYFHFRKA